jgi:hypothetical protein
VLADLTNAPITRRTLTTRRYPCATY